jgi:hypothetical protein
VRQFEQRRPYCLGFHKVIYPTLLPEEEIVHVVIDLQQFRRQFVVFYLEKAYLSLCRLLPGKSLSVVLSSSTLKKLISQFVVFY